MSTKVKKVKAKILQVKKVKAKAKEWASSEQVHLRRTALEVLSNLRLVNSSEQCLTTSNLFPIYLQDIHRLAVQLEQLHSAHGILDQFKRESLK